MRTLHTREDISSAAPQEFFCDVPADRFRLVTGSGRGRMHDLSTVR